MKPAKGTVPPASASAHDRQESPYSGKTLDGAEVPFLERLGAPDAVVSSTRIAGRLSLHAASSGPCS